MTIDTDQVQGRAGEVRGKAKGVVGGPVDDKEPGAKGNFQLDIGVAQAPAGDAEADFDIVTGKS